jgi:hypothetical protein
VLVFLDGNVDTLKRRSWEKSVLSSQPKEEEPEAVPTPKEPSPPCAVTPSPVTHVLLPTPPVPLPQKLESGEPEKKEDEKDKAREGSRLTRKFKQLYKGESYKRIHRCPAVKRNQVGWCLPEL